MTATETMRLRNALEDNTEGSAMLMGGDTSFVGTATDLPDEEVINAVKSIPTHY